MPPTLVIDDDATGDVETSGTFDPATDGIDFYESLEAMRVQVNNAVAVGPTNASARSRCWPTTAWTRACAPTRGGIVDPRRTTSTPSASSSTTTLAGDAPTVNVGDQFTGRHRRRAGLQLRQLQAAA